MNRKKGFTLVELLVVIAIIGILAGVLIIGLSANRKKAINASALTTLKSTQSLALACVYAEDLNELNKPNLNGGNQLCSVDSEDIDVWPTLPKGWKYSQYINDFDGGEEKDGKFEFVAFSGTGERPNISSNGGDPTVACNEIQCDSARF